MSPGTQGSPVWSSPGCASPAGRASAGLFSAGEPVLTIVRTVAMMSASASAAQACCLSEGSSPAQETAKITTSAPTPVATGTQKGTAATTGGIKEADTHCSNAL